MLIYAIIFMNLALVFYSVGVWSEKIQGRLMPWHLIPFLLGLVCDTTGTIVMETISKTSNNITSVFNFHGLTGLLAIILMFIHAMWAIIVLIKKNSNMILKFHKFSILVWILWLIPFASGAVSHIGK